MYSEKLDDGLGDFLHEVVTLVEDRKLRVGKILGRQDGHDRLAPQDVLLNLSFSCSMMQIPMMKYCRLIAFRWLYSWLMIVL